MNLLALLFTKRFTEFLRYGSPADIEFVEDCMKRHYAGDTTGYEDLKMYREMFDASVRLKEM